MEKKVSIVFLLLIFLGRFCSFANGVSLTDSISVDTVQIQTSHAVMEVVTDTIRVDSVATSNSSSKSGTRTLHKPEYFKPDPKKATWYALVCPGLGQIYNRSYWKLPILYGGILTFTYLIGWNNRMYNDYHNAYRDILDNDPKTNSYLTLVPDYDETQTWLQSTLKTKTKRYRRARDLSTFGLVAFYMVSVIDAFVDAHLYDFTVSDDLSLRLEPMINAAPIGVMPDARPTFSVGLQCRLRFK